MKKKRLLITGSNGFLGNNLANYFLANDYQVSGADLAPASINPGVGYHSGDLAEQETTRAIFDQVGPDLVINTVAMVDLDLCEENKALAYKINVKTAENIAKAARQHAARMIQISTDHLFDGRRSFYSEEDKPAPVNNYGLTKLQGEEACFSNQSDSVAVRTNFYGWSHAAHRPTFGEWLYQSLVEKRAIKLFKDYYFTPIDVASLAEAIETVLNIDYKGIINIAGAERCSKYEFGLAMAEVLGLDASAVVPEKIGPSSFKVKRQQDLSLSVAKCERSLNIKLPGLKAGLGRFKAGLPRRQMKNAS